MSDTTAEQNSTSWSEATEQEEQKKLDEQTKKLAINDSSVPPSASTANLMKSLQEQMDDPNNPLYSQVKSFSDFPKLNPKIIEGLEKYGFNRPSAIQEKTIPIVLEGEKNLIAQSQSGTGKTLCFVIAMLSIIDVKNKNTQALCLAPSFELAVQIHEVAKKVAEFMNVTIGMATKEQNDRDKVEGQIIIGTPGKVKSLVTRRNITTKDIKLFVLDEADQFLEEGGLRDDTIDIKGKLPKNMRVLLFSATFLEEDADPEENAETRRMEAAKKENSILEYAEKMVPEPREKILVKREKLTLEYMKQFYVSVFGEDAKIKLMKDIFGELNVGQSIIFVNSREKADRLGAELAKDKLDAFVLHGKMEVDQRKQALRDFINQKKRVLISTNVISRGIDISTVTHVINYDLPVMNNDRSKADFATYLHRIGRTARFGKKGIAINFVGGKNDEQIMQQIKQFFNIKIEELAAEGLDAAESKE